MSRRTHKLSTPRKPRIKPAITQKEFIDPALPAEGYVRVKTVLAHCGIGNTTLWRWIKEGRFPAPIALGPGRVAFEVDALRAHKERLKQGPVPAGYYRTPGNAGTAA